MGTKTLWAYAHGHSDCWEATCPDFDISVEARTFDEARRLLEEAVATYVQDALRETPRNAERLLNRRAPLWLRARLAVTFLRHIGARRRQPREMQAGFDIPCPA